MNTFLELIRDYWWVLPLALCLYHCVFGACRKRGGLCSGRGGE